VIRFGYIVRMVKSFLAEVKGIGGVTHNRFVSPKGLYSKPKDEKAVVINLSEGVNQDIILAIQKDVELEDGDVILTDDKSYIHLHFNGNGISLKTKDLVFDVDTFKVNANRVDFNGCSIKNDGVVIDNTHVHPQNNGNDFGGGVNTSAPQ